MHHLSVADGVIFMLDEEKVSEREVVKEDEEKLSETDVAKEDEERGSLRIIAYEYISNHLKGDFPRFSKVPPILFVRFKKYPEGPDEHMSDRDEGDDFAADIGLNEITKIPWSEFELWFNWLGPSDAYMRHWTRLTLVQIMASRLFSA